MRTFQEFIVEEVQPWEHLSGQLGSNPGGLYMDKKGTKHYVKFYSNPNQAKEEHASNQIFRMMGVNTPETRLVHLNGKSGIASKWDPELSSAHSDFKDPSKIQAHQLARMYHAAILTKNHDVVGLSKDNILKNRADSLHSIDQGGSFSFRAQGKRKPYDEDISEVHSFLDKSRPSGEVFSRAFSKHPEAPEKNLHWVRHLQKDDISKIFKNSGLENHEELTNTFMKRRENLLKHYG